MRIKKQTTKASYRRKFVKYKAIIFDLDGTAIPNRNDGMPSARMINAVKKAQDFVKVSIATGRSVVFNY